MNIKLILFIVMVLPVIVLNLSCGNDAPTEGKDAPAVNIKTWSVSNVRMEDIGENGNGLDILVSFRKPTIETRISEYRIIVIKSFLFSTFDLAKAEAIIPENYTRVDTLDGNKVVLITTSKDSDGELLRNDTEYKAFILTIADGTLADINALSSASHPLTLQFYFTSKVTNLALMDISNNGNASDLLIRYDVPNDPQRIIEKYKVIIMDTINASNFDLNAANALEEGQTILLESSSLNISTVLRENALDINGDLIVNGKPYVVFVLTIPNQKGSGNALSSPSDPITLGILTITYIQNNGILISNGETQILIDGVLDSDSLEGWVKLEETEQTKLIAAQPPYALLDFIMVTHNHEDHFNQSSIRGYLDRNTHASLVASQEVAGEFSDQSQIIRVQIDSGTIAAVILNNIEMNILSLRHFDALRNDYSTVENYAYLIELEGIKILHLGDADMTAENFDNFDLANEGIDVVIISAFDQSVHLTTNNRDVILNQINPAWIFVTHLPSGNIQTITNDVLAIYPEAIIFDTPLESIIFQRE